MLQFERNRFKILLPIKNEYKRFHLKVYDANIVLVVVINLRILNFSVYISNSLNTNLHISPNLDSTV